MTVMLQYIHKYNSATLFVGIAAIALFTELILMQSFVPEAQTSESLETKALMDQICSVNSIAKTAILIDTTSHSTDKMMTRLSGDTKIWQRPLHALHAFGSKPKAVEPIMNTGHVESDTDAVNAELATHQLMVQSVMRGKHSLANINGQIYQIGDVILLRGGSLKVELTEINACSVVITIPSKNGNSSTRTIFLDGYEQFVSGSHIQ